MGPVRSSGRKNITNSGSSNGRPARGAVGNGAGKSNGVKLGALIPVHNGRLRGILQLIESDRAHKIHDLALECNLSQSHLQHLFKQHTGLGLGHLLYEQRMQRAAALLAHTTR